MTLGWYCHHRELPWRGLPAARCDCSQTSGDTIDFGGDFTINLVGSALLIGKNLTIDGAGHTVTISGPGASCTTCFRMFEKTSLNTLTLNNLTVTNGYSKSTGHGGAIVDHWYGNLNITNCTFSNNSATSPTT